MWQEILVCVTRDVYEISELSMQCNSYIRKNLVMFGSGYMESEESQEDHNNRSIPVDHRGIWQETLLCVTGGLVWVSS